MRIQNFSTFSSLIAALIVSFVVFNEGDQIFQAASTGPQETVEAICRLIRSGDKKELGNYLAPEPEGFSNRVSLAYGGRTTAQTEPSPNATGPQPRKFSNSDELLDSILSNSFSLKERVVIKKVLETKEHGSEARVKVLLAESDLHRERVCTFLLIKNEDRWKLFRIDNGSLPETLKFGEKPENKS